MGNKLYFIRTMYRIIIKFRLIRRAFETFSEEKIFYHLCLFGTMHQLSEHFWPNRDRMDLGAISYINKKKEKCT